jgi:hypothetical protein
MGMGMGMGGMGGMGMGGMGGMGGGSLDGTVNTANSMSSLNTGLLSADSHRSRALDSLQRRHTEKIEPPYPIDRRITVLSTRSNLKYMAVGDRGAQDLARVLRGEGHIREVCFAGARISCSGIIHFALAMPFMSALRRLDLSNNAIADEGAFALARALPSSSILESLSLLGNRVRVRGAVALVQAALCVESPWTCLVRLDLSSNAIQRDDYELLLKLLEERNYNNSSSEGGTLGPFTCSSAGAGVYNDESRGSRGSSVMHAEAMGSKTIVL